MGLILLLGWLATGKLLSVTTGTCLIEHPVGCLFPTSASRSPSAGLGNILFRQESCITLTEYSGPSVCCTLVATIPVACLWDHHVKANVR